MKIDCSNQKTAALTLMEVLVVIAVIIALAAILMFGLAGIVAKSIHPMTCDNNLRQIGLAYQFWSGDHNDKYPMQVSITNTNENGGGTMELANGENAWINFAVMSNELSTPKILRCPTDTNRAYAANFTADFNNRKISYFVGLNADTNHPQALLSGDDNFEIGGIPIKSGLLEISSNTPIAWTAARHNHVGNLLFADGSVQSVSNSSFTNWLQRTAKPPTALRFHKVRRQSS